MDPSLSDARIHQLVYMAIQAVVGMGGLYLLLAPKPGLLKFAESYYLIRRLINNEHCGLVLLATEYSEKYNRYIINEYKPDLRP